ncbi:hypothetical protein JG687_00014349 [Phytophthora cactorum]|uniref:Uncharacterized protein n=1 Tax=Phytophthora cactorum TaxID=29920 RepID=A0A8T1TYZ8_9STRA|nr:hypothetical protein JG687_00014349 [Phytophthora cactorum]
MVARRPRAASDGACLCRWEHGSERNTVGLTPAPNCSVWTSDTADTRCSLWWPCVPTDSTPTRWRRHYEWSPEEAEVAEARAVPIADLVEPPDVPQAPAQQQMPYAPQVQQHAPPVPTQHQARFASSAPVLHQVQYAQQAPVQPQVPYAQQAPGQPQNLPQVASQLPSGPGQVHVTPLVQQPSNNSGLSGYAQVSTSAGPTNNGGTANGMVSQGYGLSLQSVGVQSSSLPAGLGAVPGMLNPPIHVQPNASGIGYGGSTISSQPVRCVPPSEVACQPQECSNGM